MSKNVIFIKLGGSIITDKQTPKKASLRTIQQLAEEIKRARGKTSDLIVIGHGSGSFGHQIASKYQIQNGLKNIDSLLGMSLVREEAAALNKIVVAEFLKQGLPVFTQSPSSFITASNKKPYVFLTSSIIGLLNKGLIPIVYGDVIVDKKIGCTIFSTEMVLNLIATNLNLYKEFKSKEVIQVGKTDGVLDQNGRTISQIDKTNYKKILTAVKGSDSVDVTGGMQHKVREAFELAKNKTSTLLISAKYGNLEKAILGEKVEGTVITFQ